MKNTNNTTDINNAKLAECSRLFNKKVLILTGICKILPLFSLYAAYEFRYIQTSDFKSSNFMYSDSLAIFTNSNVFFFIVYAIFIYFIFSDESKLKKLDCKAPSKWLGLFPPFYFWKREGILEEPKSTFYNFCIIIGLGYVLEFALRCYTSPLLGFFKVLKDSFSKTFIE